MRPFELLAPALQRARALAMRGRFAEAHASVVAHLPELAALADDEPLDPVRQSGLAFCLAFPSPSRDLAAAGDHLALARTYASPFAPAQLLWLAAAETFASEDAP